MSRLALSLPLLMSLACGSKAESTGDESSSTTGDGTSTSTGATTTTSADGSSSTSSTSEAADTTETGPVTLSISGEVSDFFEMGPIGYAQISLLDEKGSETVANPDGTYVIEDLEPNSFHRILLAENANYWGAIVPVQLEDESIDKYDLSQVSTAVIDLQEAALQDQNPDVLVDEDAAVLLIAINQNTATGATVTLDPPPAENTYYAPDANGAPILNSNLIEWGLFPVAVFFNLPPGDAGTYTVTVTHPDRECTALDPEPPTRGRHVNLIYVDCV